MSKKKYEALVPVWVDPHKTMYDVGDTMEIGNDRAKKLLAIKAIKPVVETLPVPKKKEE